MIRRSELEQGAVTYERLEREAVRLVDSLGDLAYAVHIHHRAKFEHFARKMQSRTTHAAHFQLDFFHLLLR